MAILILFKQDSLAPWAGLRRVVHPSWGSPPPLEGEAASVGDKAIPCSCSAAECQKLALFGGAVTLGGIRWVTPTVTAILWVLCLMQSHISLSRERWGGLQTSPEEQKEHWRVGGLRSCCARKTQAHRGLLVITLWTLLSRDFITLQHDSAEHGTPVCWSMQTAGIPRRLGASGTAPPPRVISVSVHIYVWYLAACCLAPIPVLGGCRDACPLSTQKHVPGRFSMAGLRGIAVQAATVVPWLFFSCTLSLPSWRLVCKTGREALQPSQWWECLMCHCPKLWGLGICFSNELHLQLLGRRLIAVLVHRNWRWLLKDEYVWSQKSW